MSLRVYSCPVPSCPNKRSSSEVMCRAHWFAVPGPLRRRVWQLFRWKQGSPEHREAVKEAIAVAEGGV